MISVSSILDCRSSGEDLSQNMRDVAGVVTRRIRF
jgi:hypothetical protein